MIKLNKINELYEQFKKDLKIRNNLPELLVLPKKNQVGIAEIGEVVPNLAELFLSDKFFDKTINDKYLSTVLYHEFTHILDRISYFTCISNTKKQKQYLLPYTEFHAAQNEMIKRLELFYNPDKDIRISTKIYDEHGIISLNKFLKIQLEQFELRMELLNGLPSKDNVRNLVYIIIYNIGYYSICNKYKIDDDLFLKDDCINYIEKDISNLRNTLLSGNPSEKLCEESHAIINIIADSICSHYKIL